MATKKDLEMEIAILNQQLDEERKRPTGHTISNCSFDTTNPDSTKIAIANAVKEGMKALQSLGGNSYALCLSSQDKQPTE